MYTIVKVNFVLLFLFIPLLTFSQGILEVTDHSGTILIANGSSKAYASDGTNFGFVAIGDSKQNTFILSNIATDKKDDIKKVTVAISGPDANNFKINSNKINKIKPGKSNNLDIEFTPSSLEIKTAIVTVTFQNGIQYTFTISGAGDPYCTPSDINNYNTYFISEVSLGTLSNASTGTTGAYTNYSTAIAPVDTNAGSTLDGFISVDLNGWNNYETNHLNIWIDFNQDFDFDDPDEHYLVLVNDPSPYIPGNKTVLVPVSIPIPADALTGNTRMRIGFTHDNHGSYSPCDYNYNAGEVEDYTINITGGCSTTNWTGAVNSNWNNAANWSCGEVPTITTNVLIPASVSNFPEIYSTDADGLVNNIEIESGATVTVFDNSIKIDGILLLNGNIILDGEGQLLQNTGSVLDATSSGRVERDQQGTADLYSYNYWGSPVGTINEATYPNTSMHSYTLESILYDGDRPVNFIPDFNGVPSSPISISNRWLYAYRDGSGSYAEWEYIGSSGTIKAGEGFSMKGSGSGTIKDSQNYTFKGLPNNGTISLVVSGGNEYLVANPYPSAIDGYQFIRDNSPSGTKALLDGTLYFWQQYVGTSHNLADYEGGYATLTLAGGTPASTPAPGISPNPPNKEDLKTPQQYLPVAQGFFTESDADGGAIDFNNGQRIFVTEASGASVFLEPTLSKSKKESDLPKDTRPKFRVGFKAPQIGHRQLLLTIDENTTNNVDWGYDGKMNGVAPDDMYWVLEENDSKYVIQGLPDANLDREIPLGIVMGKTGLASIEIDALQNVDESVELYIKDALVGETYQINNAPFEIELEAGEYNDRFLLVFKPGNTLDIDDEILRNGLYVYVNNNSQELGIKNTTNAELLGVKLYNSLGQELMTWTTNLEDKLVLLPFNNIITGMYIVQVKTSIGTISKKVIIK